MNAIEIYRQAEDALEHNRITLGEFEARIEPLKDVEKVTRCKDCKWRETNGADSTRWLPCMEIRYNDNFYCAYGERKDGE